MDLKIFDLKKKLIPPHPLTKFEIQKHYQNEPRFNGVYSRDNLPKEIKDGAYVINLDEYADVGTYWIVLYVKNIEIIYIYIKYVDILCLQVKLYLITLVCFDFIILKKMII